MNHNSLFGFEFDQKVDRRVFIKGVGWINASLFLATIGGGCETLFHNIKHRPVRRRLRTGSAQVDAAIATYKQGVTLMSALPASNPRSWAAQAAIHGTVAGGFNLCQHGTQHFFSWHRAYLLFFEQIIQKLTGDKSFGLPYWNWNQNPDMHPEFTAAASPLFHARTRTSVGGVFFNPFSGPTLDPILADSNFFTFSSQIEGSPHNSCHGIVGGDMGSGGSAIDPIFWSHHCMADYCWAKWNIELGNNNTNNSAWLNTSWNHFVDRHGHPVTVTAGATTLMPLLSYQYESSAIGSSPALVMMQVKSDYKKLEKRIRKGADVRFEVKQRHAIANKAKIRLDQPFSVTTKVTGRQFSALVASEKAPERIFASVAFPKLPPANDFFVRVFVNLPGANAQTSTEDPHYAGSFAFFGTDGAQHAGHQHHEERQFLVNVTPTLKRLAARGEFGENTALSLQLVAAPMDREFVKPDTELEVDSLELLIMPITGKTE